MIQEALLNYLLEQDAITDIVGTQIKTNHLPEQPQLPAITIRVQSMKRHENLDGPNGLVDAKIQIECWSYSYRESLDLAELVRSAVQNYRGTMGAITIHSITLSDDVETPNPPTNNSERWVYAKALIFDIFHAEPLPSN